MTSLSAFALKDDTNKPINIVSDNQSLDMENSVVTFTDNVVITQGSILIKANKVVITRPPENSGKKENRCTDNGTDLQKLFSSDESSFHTSFDSRN